MAYQAVDGGVADAWVIAFAGSVCVCGSAGRAVTTSGSRTLRDSADVTDATPSLEITANGKMSVGAGQPAAPGAKGPVTESSCCSRARALTSASANDRLPIFVSARRWLSGVSGPLPVMAFHVSEIHVSRNFAKSSSTYHEMVVI